MDMVMLFYLENIVHLDIPTLKTNFLQCLLLHIKQLAESWNSFHWDSIVVRGERLFKIQPNIISRNERIDSQSTKFTQLAEKIVWIGKFKTLQGGN